MGKKLIDLSGMKFGRLLVEEKVGHSGGKAVWRCKCDCGKVVNVRGVHLRKGRQVSCGCKKREGVKIFEDTAARRRQLYKERPEIYKASQLRYRERNREKVLESMRNRNAIYREQNKGLGLHEVVRDESHFWAKASVSESGCWEWNGSVTQSGYGLYAAMPGVVVRAHRLAYAIANGKFDESLFVCHRCDNPKCVNPDHLFLGTASDNMQDMIAKGRENRLRGEDNPTSKLTSDDVVNIFFSDGKNIEIADKYNIAPSLVSLIRHKKVWSHVTGKFPDNKRRTTGPKAKH